MSCFSTGVVGSTHTVQMTLDFKESVFQHAVLFTEDLRYQNILDVEVYIGDN